MTTPTYLLAPHDPWEEATLIHPDGTRETVSETATARVLGISLAVRGYLAPWPVDPGGRHRLQLLPEITCPPWCPGTPEAHHIEADTRARAYLQHLRVLLATEATGATSLTISQTDRVHPYMPGRSSLSVLAEDLDRSAALALAVGLMNATDLLSDTQNGETR